MPARRKAATVSRELGDAARREPRVERHEGDRVVAPGIGEAERAEVPFVDPGGDRHQLDGVDAEPVEMVEDRRVRQRADRAAQRLGNVRVEPVKGAHGSS